MEHIVGGGNWARATVIGFAENPKPCGSEALLYVQVYDMSNYEIVKYVALDQDLNIIPEILDEIPEPRMPVNGWEELGDIYTWEAQVGNVNTSYLHVDGDDIQLYQEIYPSPGGYFTNWTGWILIPPEDWYEGHNWWTWLEHEFDLEGPWDWAFTGTSATYVIDGVRHSISCAVYYNYAGLDPIEFFEIFYYNGATQELKRKTFPIRLQPGGWDIQPFVTVDGVSYEIESGPAITMAL